jgi:hypothetical protein
MRLTPLILVFACVLFAGCAGHSVDCAMGADHSDCAPGTAGHDVMVQQQEATKSFAAIDDARCRSYGAEPGSQAYVDCRRRATANH